MITGRAKLAGVMGDPVSHSLSPKLHNHWIAKAGLDAVYVPLHVKPEQLEETFGLLPRLGFRGWNVTVPHKEAALSLVGETDEAARIIGAVNTVVVKENGALVGRNTDALGFINNVEAQIKRLAPYKTQAVVLGAGGAARAVCYALKIAEFKHITVLNRTRDRADALAKAMNISSAAWEEAPRLFADATFIINTTTQGMEGQPPLMAPFEALPKTALVADIVYRPLQTALLKQAHAQGCTTVTGLGMLIHQAVPGFKAWFGVEPEITPALEKMLLA